MYLLSRYKYQNFLISNIDCNQDVGVHTSLTMMKNWKIKRKGWDCTTTIFAFKCCSCQNILLTDAILSLFKWLLFLDWDSSLYKCTLLICRRSAKRISWNKNGLPTSGIFVIKLCPSQKLIYLVWSVWWESQFTVDSRSHVLKFWVCI